jgi:hypothetical protein
MSAILQNSFPSSNKSHNVDNGNGSSLAVAVAAWQRRQCWWQCGSSGSGSSLVATRRRRRQHGGGNSVAVAAVWWQQCGSLVEAAAAQQLAFVYCQPNSCTTHAECEWAGGIFLRQRKKFLQPTRSGCICFSVRHSVCLSVRAKRGIWSKRVFTRKIGNFSFSVR